MAGEEERSQKNREWTHKQSVRRQQIRHYDWRGSCCEVTGTHGMNEQVHSQSTGVLLPPCLLGWAYLAGDGVGLGLGDWAQAGRVSQI